MTAFFMAAIGLSNVIGNPISGAILQYLDQTAGLHGWQWLFLLEGIPSIVVGFLVFVCLTNSPEQADWLSDAERQWLVNRMQQEDDARRRQHGADHWQAMLQRRVWQLIAIYFTVAVGSNASGAYFPKLIEGQFTSYDKFHIGLLSALPHLCAVVGMSLLGMSSDRHRERRWHLAAAASVAAVGWSIAAAQPSPQLTLLGLCLAQTGMMGMLPIFWTLPTTFLSGAAAAGGIALINSVANIGGFFGPTILGQCGAWTVAAILFAGSMLAIVVVPQRGTDAQTL